MLVTKYSVHFDKHQKNKFLAYNDTRFNQNLDENSYISAKIEAVKFLKSNVYFDVIRSRDSMLLLGCKVNYVPIVIVWRFSKYIKMKKLRNRIDNFNVTMQSDIQNDLIF